MNERAEALSWGREEFGEAELGDVRRTERAVRMAARASQRPGARVLDVFGTSAERQGAYDFLENDSVSDSALSSSMFSATARRCVGDDFVYVPIDGSSLQLADSHGEKDFGGVGSTARGARGLKVMSALAVTPAGVTLGLLSQIFWARKSEKKRRDCHSRQTSEKETRFWLEAMQQSAETLEKEAPSVRAWFLLDREGDAHAVLQHIDVLSKHTFTIRSRSDRLVFGAPGRHRTIADVIGEKGALGKFTLAVAAGHRRSARKAHIELRAAHVTLRLQDKSNHNHVSCKELYVVEARECGTLPEGEKPIVWRLLTNHPVRTLDDARLVVDGYAKRWRIEEFHKTWKSGACNVEQCQLRKMRHVVKWATIMAAVAVRIERLKLLSRKEPDLPASVELDPYEVSALILLKRRYKKRTETISDDMPTLAQAVTWLAEIGGYTGPKVSGGPPGSITIRRGFDQITPIAAALKQLEADGKLR